MATHILCAIIGNPNYSVGLVDRCVPAAQHAVELADDLLEVLRKPAVVHAPVKEAA